MLHEKRNTLNHLQQRVWQMECGHCSGLHPVSIYFTLGDVMELSGFGISAGLVAFKFLTLTVHRLENGRV